MPWLAAVVAATAGWAITALAVRHPPDPLRRPPHLRTNFRGREVIGTLGVVLVAPLTAGGIAGLALGGDPTPALAVAAAGTALAALGFYDDVRAGTPGGGFAGHLRSLRSGRLTSGLVKAGGGALAGLAASWGLGREGWWIVAGGAVVALSANLANLLDLRPGRTLKAWLVAWLLVLIAGPPAPAAVVTAGLAGGVAGFWPADLSERAMLGDSGANLLGAVLGTAAVAAVDGRVLLGLLAGLLVLNAASEVVSFSRVIEGVRPLRALDRLGRAD